MAYSLKEKTQILLNDRPRKLTLKDISADTGLSKHWLQKFSGKCIPHPSVDRVEKLYNYLNGKDLVV